MAIRAKTRRLSREDWLRAALEVVSSRGVGEVKISLLAKELGVTTGSFYWHFEGRQDLLSELLEWWALETTEKAIAEARAFPGPAEGRILALMTQVMTEKLARYDVAIWSWALSDRQAARVFRRAVKKRFDFASWMFEQAGFSEEQARERGRMMVVYMMGESTLVSRSMSDTLESIRLTHGILMGRERPAQG